MNDESGTDESGRHPELERRELERQAYGRPQTDDEAAGAAAAQVALLDLDAPAPTTPAFEGASDPDRAVPRRTATRTWLMLAGALVVLVAVAAAAFFGGRASLATHGPIAGTPSPTWSSSFIRVPNSSVTDRWFALRQVAADRVPVALHASRVHGEFDDGSTRLVGNVQRGRVWVARSTKPKSGYCLIYESRIETDGTRTSGVACTSAVALSRQGLHLAAPGLRVDWDALSITLTPN